MSEEQPTITNPVCPEKVKDPKRVEAGKRLASISKAAKEKKARAMIEKEIEEEKRSEGDPNWTLPIVGVVALGLAAFWYTTRDREGRS